MSATAKAGKLLAVIGPVGAGKVSVCPSVCVCVCLLEGMKGGRQRGSEGESLFKLN